MPGISIFKIFQIFGVVSMWSTKALEDGKITIGEAAELGMLLGGLLGIPTDVSIPVPEPAPAQPALVADAGEGAPGAETPTGTKPIIQE